MSDTITKKSSENLQRILMEQIGNETSKTSEKQFNMLEEYGVVEEAKIKIPKEINFKKGINKDFKTGSKEYITLGNYEDAEWDEYVKIMADKGVTVKFIENKNTFVVSS